MKQHWQKLVLRIDALSLRERAIIFAMAALVLVMLVNSALLDPQFKKQNQLSQRIKQEQSQIAGIQAEIQQKVKSHEVDPDMADRERLRQLQAQAEQLNSALQDMQKSLVPPDKMAELLESILKRNSNLRLVSLKSMPATSITEALAHPGIAASDKSAAAAAGSNSKTLADAIYRHGMEIKMQGGYLDMLNYMAALEAVPWQLLWGRVELSVDEFPKATLTLTLYTLSLDKQWLNL
ncbi:MAG TPA: MSHA biogenesis protein MshJ [Noviherbaspirillum sp.]|uniref:MSHA biogenesis protein MshJ n=1 Tax=Noviherbaspirillum sp. TaxID=1926288 RepID=UPI002D222796|nr:MSHA biogenesis protein MshJ [Noviherbaspirillum sp.]HYD96057.1 MSHA biogenesis protein MshJ [Noviherbaspirillum sp.]